MALTPRLERFYAYWRERQRKGEVSGISRLEAMMLEIYEEWLALDGGCEAEHRADMGEPHEGHR